MNLRFARVILMVTGLMGPAAFAAAPTPAAKPTTPTAAASKTLSEARANLAKAKGQVDAVRKRIAVSFESKPDWKAAKESLDQAKADFEAASRRVTAKLEKNPAYLELITKRDKSQAAVSASAKTDASSDDATKLTPEDLDKAQQERVNAAVGLKKMEREANDNDPKLVTARQKLKEAQQGWDALQSQIDDAMKLDPAYPPLQLQVDQAEQALKTAQEAYNTAAKTSTATPRSRPPVKKY